MRFLAFDINRDSVSATHNISDRRVWIPQSESESDSPATSEREPYCNNFGNPKVSTLDPPPSRTEDGRGILGELFRFVAIPVMWRSFRQPATGTARTGSAAT